MTADVITLLDEIKDLDIFETEPLYFVGGTALAYYLEHRISEDIDIISTEQNSNSSLCSIEENQGICSTLKQCLKKTRSQTSESWK